MPIKDWKSDSIEYFWAPTQINSLDCLKICIKSRWWRNSLIGSISIRFKNEVKRELSYNAYNDPPMLANDDWGEETH